MKIIVIDGQGGSLGKAIIEQIKKQLPQLEPIALGANSIATAAMIKAGARSGATGENPVLVNARDADIIMGPIGIIAADSLLGEITPAMAIAIGQSPAIKLLIPMGKCRVRIVGLPEQAYAEYVRQAVDELKKLIDQINAGHNVD